MKKPLTAAEKHVIIDKGTEAPFKGKYDKFFEEGIYTCRLCGAKLYRSQDKFDSGCGWPAFDDEIPGAVKRIKDSDGRRTEILCAKCGAHLGHVFEGEQLTDKNVRHCVNSISMEFTPAANSAVNTPTASATPAAATGNATATIGKSAATQEAIFAGGCFWGVEHLMQKQAGVLSVESGYIGGDTPNPTYEQVCSKTTGHAEAVRVIFDPSKVSYESLAKLFFEIHDPTQTNGQGPDLGPQYRSEIFFTSPEQQQTAARLMLALRAKGYKLATRLTPATTFYPAEKYHQDYYERKGTEPYCHAYTPRF